MACCMPVPRPVRSLVPSALCRRPYLWLSVHTPPRDAEERQLGPPYVYRVRETPADHLKPALPGLKTGTDWSPSSL